ncbi:HEAT repeat domain-containing protein [Streptomyces sp. NPDC006733]|uniref:HEAT repeat domain-containing protein n=1 Tax=Streptomyces sp. NPDC006733 TaxID=3155460 RepID=UPI0033FF361C
MDIERLTEMLSGTWDRTRSARDALVAQGAVVVGPVLGVLCDERSPVDWTVSADVLSRIGEPALDPLAAAVAAAVSPAAARRTQGALNRLKVADPAVYAALLDHAHPQVRSSALSAFQSQGPAALRFLDRLVPLLGDQEPGVRQRAGWALKAIGAGAVPELQRLRRQPATRPQVRAGVLQALAAIGGPAALDGRDQEAWRRLTTIKRLSELPEGMHLCGSWYAVSTDHQDAVLAAFDLGDPEPVTLRTGAGAWNHDRHNWSSNRSHDRCARVFVSPALGGWTLVFGHSSRDTHHLNDADNRDEALTGVVRQRCAELSRQFGAAQWYGMSCGDDWTAWCIAEAGAVVRYYDAYDVENADGPGHRAESGYLLPHQDGFPDNAFDGVDLSDSAAFTARYRQVKEELHIPDTCYATNIAARLAVNPGELRANTVVDGYGVLALTECGRVHGHPAGALPV